MISPCTCSRKGTRPLCRRSWPMKTRGRRCKERPPYKEDKAFAVSFPRPRSGSQARRKRVRALRI